MGFKEEKGSQKVFVEGGVSRRCLECPVREYDPLDVCPIQKLHDFKNCSLLRLVTEISASFWGMHVACVLSAFGLKTLHSLKVACLQSELCVKYIFFKATNFSYEKCSENFPEMFEPLFVVQKRPAKFPPKFP